MKNYYILAIFPLLWCFLSRQEGYAATWNNPDHRYDYVHLTISKGLCDNSVRAIYKDRNSFMWLGTSNGLDRYDGYEFKHYSTASPVPYQFIESNYINDIGKDDSHNLWVASEVGIMRIDLSQGNVKFFKEYTGANSEVLSTPIQTLYIDDLQNLWLGKSDCLAYVILNGEREIIDVQVLKTGVNIKTIIRHGSDIWAGGTGCLFRFISSTAENYTSVSVTTSFDVSLLIFNCLFSYGDYLWIGTQSGLYCYNTQNQLCTVYRHNPRNENSLSSDFITSIDKNSSGDMIIGTRSGINVYQLNDRFVRFGKESQSRSLNDNVVNRVFMDENNTIWVGTDFGGVNMMTPERISFRHELQGYDKGTPNVISTVLEDREGNILIGIVDGGLAVKRHGSPEFVYYRHDPDRPESLAHNNISDIVQDFNGDYWISTIGGYR